MKAALTKIAAIDLRPTEAVIAEAQAQLAQLEAAEQSAEHQAEELAEQIRNAVERGRDGAALADALLEGRELPSGDVPALRERLGGLRAAIAVIEDRKREQRRVVEAARHELGMAIGAAMAPARDEFEETATEAVQALLDAYATLAALVESGHALCLANTRSQLAEAIAGIQHSPIAANLHGRISIAAMEILQAAKPAIELAGRKVPNAITGPATRGFFGRMRAA